MNACHQQYGQKLMPTVKFDFLIATLAIGGSSCKQAEKTAKDPKLTAEFPDSGH
jgi:hypothetical protein